MTREVFLMSKNTIKSLVLIFILLLLLTIGCNDQVNFGKAEKVVASFVSAQVEGDKQTVNSLISQELKKQFNENNQYFQEKYNLDKPNLVTTNIFELQSDEKQKVIVANYHVEAQGEKLNISSLFLLEKKGDKWIIESLEEISLSRS